MKKTTVIDSVLRGMKFSKLELEYKFVERRKGLGYGEDYVKSDETTRERLFANKRADSTRPAQDCNDESSKRDAVRQKGGGK